ncbi:hypothetical protein FFLO_06861 [Filobasidium floriforme]|uniref:Uncharacterized protein n=1 Tax=Filobasidium floriforme TaxID=5210 RepID=A0A8K0NMM1_9TREE|nr:uncharacterized protein HD553DRAFT_340387 [Filobasidium floriforme]KAG7527515.1 hypothetical protein FFLO_06861 [Filobasidium floriforme]KAH8087225.1 hypothetical protein HD553DRAFT_340387 [Filobasidium floriforme]
MFPFSSNPKAQTVDSLVDFINTVNQSQETRDPSGHSVDGSCARSGRPTAETRSDSDFTRGPSSFSFRSNDPRLSKKSIEADVTATVADDNLFGLLIAKDLCPPSLKASKKAKGWQRLVTFFKTEYENYLTSEEYKGGFYRCTTDTRIVFGLKSRISFCCTGPENRLVSVHFRMDVFDDRIQGPECPKFHEEMHLDFDESFTSVQAQVKVASLGETLGKLDKGPDVTVQIHETEDSSAAWWRAFGRISGWGKGHNGLYLFYGVIDPSGDPAHKGVDTASNRDLNSVDEDATASDSELDNDDEGECRRIKRSAREDLEEDWEPVKI